MRTHDLAGAAEASTLLKVTRARLDQLAATYDDFPKPLTVLAAGRIWSRAELKDWQKRHRNRRPGRPRTNQEEAA